MKTLIINIDWVPDNFSASVADESVACVATGETLTSVESNIIEALAFHLEGLISAGEPIPEALTGDWQPEFHLSTRAQLKYLNNYISRKALARETGIAEQQLSHYANGQRVPRPATQRRITAGIRSLVSRLSLIL